MLTLNAIQTHSYPVKDLPLNFSISGWPLIPVLLNSQLTYLFMFILFFIISSL